MAIFPLLTFATWKPCDWSQEVTVRMSASAGPNWAPNCSGVSHLWEFSEAAFCWSTIHCASADSCSTLRFITSNIRCMGNSYSNAPRSNSGRARGWTLPWRRTSCVSSIAWVMRTGMDAVCAAGALSGLVCAAARKAGSARVKAKTKRELRSIRVWSFISRPRCRFEFDSNSTRPASRPGPRDARGRREKFLRGHADRETTSTDGFAPTGAWTRNDSPLNATRVSQAIRRLSSTLPAQFAPRFGITPEQHPLSEAMAILMHPGLRRMPWRLPGERRASAGFFAAPALGETPLYPTPTASAPLLFHQQPFRPFIWPFFGCCPCFLTIAFCVLRLGDWGAAVPTGSGQVLRPYKENSGQCARSGRNGDWRGAVPSSGRAAVLFFAAFERVPVGFSHFQEAGNSQVLAIASGKREPLRSQK